MPQTRWDSWDIRAALHILRTSTRAPQNIQTAAEVHSLVAIETDAREMVRINTQCAAIEQAAAKFSPPPAKVKRMAMGVVLAAEPGPGGWRNAGVAATEGQLCCESGWARGHCLWPHIRQGNYGRRHACPTGLRTEETWTWAT